jgi:hypothetical protein
VSQDGAPSPGVLWPRRENQPHGQPYARAGKAWSGLWTGPTRSTAPPRSMHIDSPCPPMHMPHAQIDNEPELLAQLRAKLGPDPTDDHLLFHIRNARGKLHWAGG